MFKLISHSRLYLIFLYMSSESVGGCLLLFVVLCAKLEAVLLVFLHWLTQLAFRAH